MIFVCPHCGDVIPELNTPGDEVNKNLICPKCSDDLLDLLKKAKQIQTTLLTHFKRIP